MRPINALVALILLTASAAQEREAPAANGTIFGTVIGQDGNPARDIGLTADFRDPSVMYSILPHTKSNDMGEYRFERLPWGRYTVYADDENAGYSSISTGPAGKRNVAEVKIAPEHPMAEFTVHLPPRAGFLHIHLTDRKTGALISGMQIEVMTAARPPSLL